MYMIYNGTCMYMYVCLYSEHNFELLNELDVMRETHENEEVVHLYDFEVDQQLQWNEELYSGVCNI